MGLGFYRGQGAGDTNIQSVTGVLDNGPEAGVPSMAYDDHRLGDKGSLSARHPCFPGGGEEGLRVWFRPLLADSAAGAVSSLGGKTGRDLAMRCVSVCIHTHACTCVPRQGRSLPGTPS